MTRAAIFLVLLALSRCGAPNVGDARRSAHSAVHLLSNAKRPFMPYDDDLIDEANEAAIALDQPMSAEDQAKVTLALAEDICGIMATKIIEPASRAQIDRDLETLDLFSANTK